MVWHRVRNLPLPVLVAIIGVPLLLLAAGSVAIVLSRPSQPRTTVGAATTGPSPSECPSADAATTPAASPDASQSACPSASPSPSPSPSASASASATAGAATPSCAASPGSMPSSIPANFPTAMAFAPDGRLFWAERAGTVKVWQNGASRTFATVPASTSGERGLLGLALTPGFASDHYVYGFYSRSDDPTLQRVVRWTDCGGNASALTTVVDNLPAGPDCCHKGGRIAFSPDGFLFVTIGDNHARNGMVAQDPNDLRGKVLRYSAGGAAAGINGTPVYTLGLRNPFGIAFAPDGRMGITNNGPSHDAGTPCGGCGDIFDLVGTAAGVRYQWPYCWGYSHPFGGSSDCHGLAEPSFSTEQTGQFVAPTGVTYARGHFLFCADQGNGHVFQYNGPRDVSDTGMGGCLLHVKQAPDGTIYTAGGSSISRHQP